MAYFLLSLNCYEPTKELLYTAVLRGCRRRPGHGHRQDRNGFHTRSHTTAYPVSCVPPGAPWQVLPPTGRHYYDAAREWTTDTARDTLALALYWLEDVVSQLVRVYMEQASTRTTAQQRTGTRHAPWYCCSLQLSRSPAPAVIALPEYTRKVYDHGMRIVSWNVNGIRAVVRKQMFHSCLATYDPDVICLQETKAHPGQVTSTCPSTPTSTGTEPTGGVTLARRFSRKLPPWPCATIWVSSATTAKAACWRWSLPRASWSLSMSPTPNAI